MNNISELISIIYSIGGQASTEAIAEAYGKKYKMPLMMIPKSVIETTLSSRKDLVRRNCASNQWELRSDTSKDILLISDNRFFPTIRAVMSEVFNKNVNSGSAYFSIDDRHAAWFPQFGNEKWENTYSEDGKFWYEKPRNNETDYTPDNKTRYIFIHEINGYRFTGVFRFNGFKEDKTREYELIDDKVYIVKPRPRLVICRVAYMKFYNGITADDIPINGGSYVTENNDAFEKYNFHRYDDGYCYGFIETKYKRGHTADNNYARAIGIEQIDPLYKNESSIENVRVVMMAFSPSLKKNVVVGWYDNATVYRNRVIESDKTYMLKCLAHDAHLIPDKERYFEVPRASGNEFGIGQSNFWYIQKFEAAREYEDKLTNYIDSLNY